MILFAMGQFITTTNQNPFIYFRSLTLVFPEGYFELEVHCEFNENLK